MRVKENETAVLAGVLQHQTSASLNGTPGIAAIPEIGLFAGDQNNQNQDQELLILVTPRMVRLAPRTDHAIYAGQGELEGPGGAAPAGANEAPLPPQFPPGQRRQRRDSPARRSNRPACRSQPLRWERRLLRRRNPLSNNRRKRLRHHSQLHSRGPSNNSSRPIKIRSSNSSSRNNSNHNSNNGSSSRELAVQRLPSASGESVSNSRCTRGYCRFCNHTAPRRSWLCRCIAVSYSMVFSRSERVLTGGIRRVHEQVWITLALFVLAFLLAREMAGHIVDDDLNFLYLIAFGLIGCVAIVSIARNWRLGFCLFNVWLLFEDFVRKYMGNGTALFFGKDVLALLIYLSLIFAIRRGKEKVLHPPFLLWFPLSLFMWLGAFQIFNPNSPAFCTGCSASSWISSTCP